MSAFAKKVMLITGSTSGIGRATANLIAREGGSVTLHGQSEVRLKQTLELLKKQNIPESRIHHVLGSIADEKVQKKLVDETIDKFGRLDVLVNNAGVLTKKGLGHLDLENLDYVFNINAKSAFSLILKAHPYLKQTKGNIVNVSSNGPHIAVPIVLSYVQSKAALEQQTRQLAVLYARDGIRVNAVCPGLIITNIANDIGIGDEKAFEQGSMDFVKKNYPMGRMGKPDEVANLIGFLASDRASYMTGNWYMIDGGALAGWPVEKKKSKAK